MKTNRLLTLIAYVEVFLAILSVDVKSESGAGRLTLDPDFARFVSEKKALTTTLAKKHEVTVPSMVWQFFDAAEKGDWETTTNTFARLLASPGGYGKAAWVPQEIWGPVHDTLGAAEQFHGWNPELCEHLERASWATFLREASTLAEPMPADL